MPACAECGQPATRLQGHMRRCPACAMKAYKRREDSYRRWREQEEAKKRHPSAKAKLRRPVKGFTLIPSYLGTEDVWRPNR
jgi:uncharacterized Zn finger protein (UPF0148 family)